MANGGTEVAIGEYGACLSDNVMIIKKVVQCPAVYGCLFIHD